MTATLSCSCGSVTGSVSDKSLRAGMRLLCHCRDCRAFQMALGRDDPGAQSGVDIIQVPPAGLTLTGELAALRLSPRGPLRFYAPCCGTPIATTMTSRAIPFAGLLTEVLTPDVPRPKIAAWIHRQGPNGTVTHKRMGRVALRILSNAAGACLRGERTKTPFFDAETGAPIVAPEVIEKSRKAAIYAQL